MGVKMSRHSSLHVCVCVCFGMAPHPGRVADPLFHYINPESIHLFSKP